MSRSSVIVAALFACAAPVTLHAQSTAKPAGNSVDVLRGKYLVQVAGCNDCHTAGYPEAAGKVDEKAWLTGVPLGWSGPWGTTYASNLRLVAASMTEAQWMKHARTPTRPPMPWFALRDMNDADVAAIYRYLRALGPAGQPAPAYVPPGQAVQGPVITFPKGP